MAFNARAVSEITKIAQKIGVEPAALLAVAEVESAGVVFWNINGKRLAPIRFEGHYFWRRLKGAQRQRAANAGLASPKAGRVRNGSRNSRYAMLARAAKIDHGAAIESCSWGLGQVMGAHWRKLGFASADALMNKAQEGAAGQVEIMARFIQKFGLKRHLISKNWAAFAKAYNGPAYRKNRYDVKMRSAYRRWKAKGHGGITRATSADDELVTRVQKQLRTLGLYKGRIDGIDNPELSAAIRTFQSNEGLVPDGIAGSLTQEELADEVSKKEKGQGDKAVGVGASGVGIMAVLQQLFSNTGLGNTVREWAFTLQSFGIDLTSLKTLFPSGDTLKTLVTWAIIAGVVYLGWGAWKKWKNRGSDEGVDYDPYLFRDGGEDWVWGEEDEFQFEDEGNES